MRRFVATAAAAGLAALALYGAPPAQARPEDDPSVSPSRSEAGDNQGLSSLLSGVTASAADVRMVLPASAELPKIAQLHPGATATSTIDSLLRPRGAPAFPGSRQLRILPKSRLSTHRTYACYRPGAFGYQADCVNGTENYSHWGAEPYKNSGRRYVWVVDELPAGSRERAWLGYMVYVWNKVASDPNRPPGGDRPVFLYYTAEQLGSSWRGCSVRAAQIIEVCALAPGARSYAAYSVVAATGHFWEGSLHIATGVPPGYGDAWTESVMAQEFGHILGFAHDTNCNSVMTYCSTFGRSNMWYGNDQVWAYWALYDRHGRG